MVTAASNGGADGETDRVGGVRVNERDSMVNVGAALDSAATGVDTDVEAVEEGVGTPDEETEGLQEEVTLGETLVVVVSLADNDDETESLLAGDRDMEVDCVQEAVNEGVRDCEGDLEPVGERDHDLDVEGVWLEKEFPLVYTHLRHAANEM